MTHDPLCPISKYPNNYPRCACDLITRVREDAIAAAVQRVERISKEDGGYCYVLHYCDVIDAINGWQPTEDKITFIRGNDRLEQLRKNNS